MNENIRKFLEAVSQDKELIEKLKKAETPEAVIALAAEMGFPLTAEDLEQQPGSDIVSDDELDAVAGGKTCVCVLGGGGEKSGRDLLCWCTVEGYGTDIGKNMRCGCFVGGGGEDTN